MDGGLPASDQQSVWNVPGVPDYNNQSNFRSGYAGGPSAQYGQPMNQQQGYSQTRSQAGMHGGSQAAYAPATAQYAPGPAEYAPEPAEYAPELAWAPQTDDEAVFDAPIADGLASDQNCNCDWANEHASGGFYCYKHGWRLEGQEPGAGPR